MQYEESFRKIKYVRTCGKGEYVKSIQIIYIGKKQNACRSKWTQTNHRKSYDRT